MEREMQGQGRKRREFLKLAGLGAVAGAAAVVGAKQEVRAEEVAGRRRAGYQLSEHVRRVYELARF